MKKYIALSALTLLLASCGTIISGTTQEISFDSNIKNTKIFIDNKEVCQTPCITTLDRGRGKILVQAKKSGYEDKTMFIDKTVNPMTLVNVASTIFSTFGLTSDLTTDGFWEYSPDAFYVVMQKEPQTQAEKKQRAYENKIRHFVLQNYAELQNDIFSNYGEHEYLDTLTSMTKLSKTKIRIIFDHCSNEGECAEKVVDAYISK